MPLFLVKREVFEWIRAGRKNVELRKGRAKKGDEAVFQCGRKLLKRKIIKREEGNLTCILRRDNYKNIIPQANTPRRGNRLHQEALWNR